MANIIQTFPTGAGGGSDIQVTSLPTASASELGKIYQYVGADTSSLTNGFFYECIEDSSTSPSTYDWEVKNVDEDETVEISKTNFDLLTPAEKNNGKAYFIPDMDVVTNYTVMGNRFDKANIYTADERMIGSWMGKPVYQKSYFISRTASSSICLIDSTISRTTMTPIVTNGYLKLDNGNWISAGYLGKCNFIIDESGFRVNTDGQYSFSDVYATLQYTKTNDATVNIGTGNDYSTDEQIIGTWIDGKKLYQKTIAFDNLSSETVGSYKLYTLIATDENMSFAMFVNGVCYDSQDNRWYSLPNDRLYSPSDKIIPELYVDVSSKKTYLKFTVPSSASYQISKVIVTIQYTKTTD